ncbi:MAG TPA: hypothetical protein VK930_09295 [Verrucomicrobiae bacterium]|nr:hypothetical protein [Verrucomicrobiae bacterium]
MSSYPLMVNPRQAVRPIILASLLLALSAGSVSLAYGQQFTLSVSAFTPKIGVDPGGSATATIDLEPIGTFDGSVSLSCAVTSNQFTTNLPACTVSPALATPPADGPALTITTTGGTGASATSAGTYQVTVTGTGGTTTQTQTLYLSVADLTEDYTLSVSPTIAIPSPLPAGSAATTVVTVLPIGSYSGQVTLACLSVSPIVTAAPYCTFDPATVSISSSTGATSTLTIATFGRATSTRLWNLRMFYAFWLAVPGLALVGARGARSYRKNLLAVFCLVAIAGSLLLLSACPGPPGTTALNGQITPNNTYIFTLTGADANGAAPSNVPPNADVATVTLQVTTAHTAN